MAASRHEWAEAFSAMESRSAGIEAQGWRATN
jgi:hypothetical protein